MPNYGLVINSRFRPFSYQELLAPTLQATQAHQAVEDAYGNLQVQADQWKRIADEEPDSKAAKMYNNYAQSLESAAEDLISNGLNPSSRQSLWNMTKRYSSEINPIAEAYKRKQTQAEEQRKSGNRYIYDYDAATTSIDKFLDNSTLNYQAIDRLELLQRSQAIFQQFADQLRDFRYDKTKLDRFHNTLIKNYGFHPDDAAAFAREIANGRLSDNDAVNILARNLYDSTKVDNWNNDLAKKQVWNTIAEGISMGIGKEDRSLVTDEMALAKYKKSLETPPYNVESNPYPYFNVESNPYPLRATQELDEVNKTLLEYGRKGYIEQDKDGNWKLTKKGLDEYNRKIEIKHYNNDRGASGNAAYVQQGNKTTMTTSGAAIFINNASGYTTEKKHSAFYDYINGIKRGQNREVTGSTEGSPFLLGSKGNTYESTENFVNRILQDHQNYYKEGSYDVYESTGYRIHLTPEQQTAWTEALFNNSDEGKVQEAHFTGKNGFSTTAKKHKTTDLTDYQVEEKTLSSHGNILHLRNNKTNETLDILEPERIHPTGYRAERANLQALTDADLILRKGKRPLKDNNGMILRDANGVIRFTGEDLTPEEVQSITNNKNIYYMNAEEREVKKLQGATTTSRKY